MKSEALRAVFGLHNPLSRSPLELWTLGSPRSTSLGKTVSERPPGLGNWDNSCYQNSVIQGLASLPSLRNYLAMNMENDDSDTGSTKGALLDMISKLQDSENFGQRFWIRGILKSMSTWQQQDAQEYYSKILDALDKEAQKASKSKRRSTASWSLAVQSLSKSLTLPESEPQTSTHSEIPPVATKSDAVKESDELPPPPEQPNVIPNPLDGLLAQPFVSSQRLHTSTDRI